MNGLAFFIKSFLRDASLYYLYGRKNGRPDTGDQLSADTRRTDTKNRKEDEFRGPASETTDAADDVPLLCISVYPCVR